ncbi:MAG: hypothetical protein ACLP0L_24500 [Solirubrobacteraceae bacterium]
MLAVELVAAGLIVVLVVALARLAWVISHRSEGESITEAQARENAAPLTKAIWRRTVAGAPKHGDGERLAGRLAEQSDRSSDRRDKPGRDQLV